MYTDMRKRVIYLRVLLPFLAAGIIWHFIRNEQGIIDIAGGVLTGLMLLLVSRLSKGRIGTGDGLLLIVSGVLLGAVGNLMLLTIAFLLAAFFSIILLTFRKCRRDTELPFAPFLFGAFFITMALR